MGETEKKKAEKGHVWKESAITTQGRREKEVGTLLLGNDKNNVTADKVLSYFYCFRSIYNTFCD